MGREVGFGVSAGLADSEGFCVSGVGTGSGETPGVSVGAGFCAVPSRS